MIELVDTLPDISVQPEEFKRLLGYPRERVIEGRARELVDWARTWYLKNGRPWVYARHAKSLDLSDSGAIIDGAPFSSKHLQQTFTQSQSHSAVLVAVSAGPELEREAQRLWQEEKPDEYFFLEMYGSAVVEHLTTMTGARLCAWADRHELAVLPHYSPGYPEWDVNEQPRLLELLRQNSARRLPGELETFDTGMLRPKKSQLAIFGLTRYTQHVRRLTDLIPCESCSYLPCQFRRTPYRRASERSDPETTAWTISSSTATSNSLHQPLDLNAKYTVNPKALSHWTEERLTLTNNPDGTVDALFHYDGTTCTNMGRPLSYHYQVKLGPRAEGYPIREQSCQPAPGDTGHTYMCRYMNNAEHLIVAIDQEKPLAGQPLNDILTWQRPNDLAGCYCEPASRKHKWGLVLETIHFALSQKESR